MHECMNTTSTVNFARVLPGSSLTHGWLHLQRR